MAAAVDDAMTTTYAEFLQSKRIVTGNTGREVPDSEIHPTLFPFQRDLVRWALRKGRAAVFADTGLGKTLIQLEWARLTGQKTLILAPLAVASQTVKEAKKIGLEVVYARKQVNAGPLTITNYEMVEHFNPSEFGAVVLDESSILKSFDGKTRTRLIELFRKTPFRLCCTATPAPNDIAEMANHAEFLGAMARVEMLATFFVHDDQGWRLKRHAKADFYRWLASWGMSLKKPSDLGYSDDGFRLPPLSILPVIIEAEHAPADRLFAVGLKGIQERASMRKATQPERVARAIELIEAEPEEPWIAWVGLNEEGREIAKALADSVLVEGAQSPEEKAERLDAFVSGCARVLVTKPTIAGFGLNLQHCARMAFVGLGDSYEQYYQSIRRCYRFGQQRPVIANIVLTDAESAIHANVMRKEQEAERMSAALLRNVAEYERAEIGGGKDERTYAPAEPMRLPDWIGANGNGS